MQDLYSDSCKFIQKHVFFFKWILVQFKVKDIVNDVHSLDSKIGQYFLKRYLISISYRMKYINSNMNMEDIPSFLVLKKMIKMNFF